jgi:hypothetical protein
VKYKIYLYFTTNGSIDLFLYMYSYKYYISFLNIIKLSLSLEYIQYLDARPKTALNDFSLMFQMVVGFKYGAK